MPLSLKQFTEVIRGLPADASQDQVNEAAKAHEAGTPLQKIWETVNRPIGGSEDALVPAFRHKHADDEGTVRRVAEDFGASLTSPLNVATTAVGVGAGVAGAKGLLGISRAARGAEAALQAPLVAEGAKNILYGDTAGEKLGGVAEAALGAHGVKSALTHAFEPSAVVKTYMKEKGLEPRARTSYDPKAAMATADAYEAMPHTPQDPAVKASYSSLKTQIDDQHKFLAERAGVKMEPWTKPGQPYANSAELQADVTKNNHLYFFPTDEGYGEGAQALDHPMLDKGADGAVPNDKFRAVHDYFGHASEGNQFGPKGEEAAFQKHQETLTPDAHGALATETKGQNSWVNSGAHLRNEAGVVPKKGEPGFVAPQDRPFAEQKAGLLPEYQRQPGAELQGDELARAQTSAPDAMPHSASTPSNPTQRPGAALTLSPELLADVSTRHGAGGGSSTSLSSGKAVTPQEARYLLSPYEDRQLVLDNPPTEQDLRNFVAKNEDLLAQPGHNLGTWFNADGDKKHYIDVSIGENDLGKATSLAKQHNQLAMYDLVEGKDISTADAPKPPSGAKLTPSMAMSVAAPAAASQIDDSDPNDPNHDLKHYGKIALGIATAYGLGNTALAAPIRKTAMNPMKAASAKGAAYMLLGGSKVDWAKKMLADGVEQTALPKVRAGAEKILSAQLAKVDGQMPNAKKLMAHFETGKAEMGWYDDVHKELTELFGKDAGLMAHLLAATSTNSTVKSNTTLALKAYRSIKLGEPIESGYLPVVVKQINRVIKGEGLEGRKIDNFAKAIVGDENAVVVDRWMLRAFGFKKDAATPHEYDVIEHAVKEMASKAGVTPRQMQASIWFSVKNKAEEGMGRPESPAYGTLLKEKLAANPLQ